MADKKRQNDFEWVYILAAFKNAPPKNLNQIK